MKSTRLAKTAALLLAAGIFAAGCGSPDNKMNNTSASSSAPKTADSLKGCYVAVLKKDTFQLAITEVNGNELSGSLIYNFAEKDRSKGTIEGNYENGILSARYIFNAEGTTSERPVIFKKVAEGFIEGYGETKLEGGKEVFAKSDTISFNQGEVLKYTETCLP
ncbi:MAG: hypothetical protein ACO1NU_08990 [Arcticibacter sp.]